MFIIKLCQPKEEITEETSLTRDTQTLSAASTALSAAPRTRPSRDSRCATLSMDLQRETLKTTMLLTRRTSLSPRSTSSHNTVLPAVSTLVSFVLDQSRSVATPKVNVSRDTPPSSETSEEPRIGRRIRSSPAPPPLTLESPTPDSGRSLDPLLCLSARC